MEYIRSLDKKGGLFIPAELRKKLGKKVVIIGWFRGCLSLYAQNKWEKLVAEWKNLPFKKEVEAREARRVRRFILSHSMDLRIDNRGRILIPGYLKKHASLSPGGKVAIISNDYLEIWNEKNWRKRRDSRSRWESLLLSKLGRF